MAIKNSITQSLSSSPPRNANRYKAWFDSDSLTKRVLVAVLIISILYFLIYLVIMFKFLDLEQKKISQIEATIPAGAIITLDRGPCYGRCPDYKLYIYENGRVIYFGRKDVKVRGIQTAQLSQDKIKLLINEFLKINYFSLPERFENCAFDFDSAQTSFTMSGKTKTIFDYHGCYPIPQELIELEDKIDEITNSIIWVGKCADYMCEKRQ